MSKPATDSIDRIDSMLGKLDRLSKLQVWIVGMTAAAVLWGARLEFRVSDHDKRVDKLETRTDIMLQSLSEMKGRNGGVSQSVNVGQSKPGDVQEASAKTWLTTKDVAERENITERTVINYIENGMIDPTPRKNGKAWEIAANFRIVPNDSESCGEMPQAP